jgi:DNA polymerase III delta prime subunit
MTADRFFGGVSDRLSILTDTLAHVDDATPTSGELAEWITEKTDATSTDAVNRHLSFLDTIGLIDRAESGVTLDMYGTRWLQEQDSRVLFTALQNNVKGFSLLLKALYGGPLTDEEIRQLLVRYFDEAEMSGTGPAKRHREWLQVLGYVQRDGEGSEITQSGTELVMDLSDEPNLAEDIESIPDEIAATGSGYWKSVKGRREQADTFLQNPTQESFETLLGSLWSQMDRFLEYDTAQIFDEEARTPEEVAEVVQDAVETGSQARLCEVKRISTSKATEIMRAVEPETYPILSTRSRKGIQTLGYAVPQDVTDEEYDRFCTHVEEAIDRHSLVDIAREEIEIRIPEWATPIEIADFLFSWHISDTDVDLRAALDITPAAPFYWVNQSDESELRDGYLQAPSEPRPYYDLPKLEKGDIIFSSSGGDVKGYHTVQRSAELQLVDSSDEDPSYRVETEYTSFSEPLAFPDIFPVLYKYKLHKYSPVSASGVNQQYLFNLSRQSGEFLFDQAEIDPDETPTKPTRGDELASQLVDTNQSILHGPPGTGKTYTATRFARWWVNDSENTFPTDAEQIRSVTFHPSFSYEDFVEGLTVNAEGDQVEYDYEEGVFMQIYRDAKRAYEGTPAGMDPPRFVLVIDEINRGDLSQIFGELITLLEQDKRLGQPNETTVHLSHSGVPITLPPNLYLIGTMNTADRSIALVDAALRRRFSFHEFPPAMDIVHTKYGFDSEDDVREAAAQDQTTFKTLIARSILAISAMNRRIITESDLTRGKQIGHTYLLGLDDGEVDEIVSTWKFELFPLLEEYYYGDIPRLRADVLNEQVGTETGAQPFDSVFDADLNTLTNFDASDLDQALNRFLEREGVLESES